MPGTQSATKNLGIVLFDDVEVLDFCGPFEVFSVSNRAVSPPAFRVLTVAESSGAIAACNGLSVNPAFDFSNCPPLELLLVPGGIGTRREMRNPAMIRWVRQRAAEAELVMSVCTGALILGAAGLLDSLDVTTHHAALDLLQATVPKANVRDDQRWIDTGRIVTSGGISAGIDMSFHVVRRYLGDAAVARTAKDMEYAVQATPAAPTRHPASD